MSLPVGYVYQPPQASLFATAQAIMQRCAREQRTMTYVERREFDKDPDGYGHAV